MAGRPRGDEGVVDLAGHHLVDREDRAAGGAQRRFVGARRHGRVLVEPHPALRRRRAARSPAHSRCGCTRVSISRVARGAASRASIWNALGLQRPLDHAIAVRAARDGPRPYRARGRRNGRRAAWSRPAFLPDGAERQASRRSAALSISGLLLGFGDRLGRAGHRRRLRRAAAAMSSGLALSTRAITKPCGVGETMRRSSLGLSSSSCATARAIARR